MKEIQIVCKRGSARIAWRKSFIGVSLKILTGQRRKWDDFNWSFFSDSSEIALQGLWRGRYADAVASTEEVLRALIAVGAVRSAEGIVNAGWQPGDVQPPAIRQMMKAALDSIATVV